ncbi:MAG: polar amino acid transport system substrate-binding protein [Phenylobacterium sp.]|jgi:polar amino acid transport system substrate-binding protein
MKKFLLNLFLFLSLVSLPMAVVVAKDKALTVVTEDWRPYNYQEQGEVKGISTAIVKKVLAKAKIDYNIAVYPWARAYKLAQAEQHVLIYTIIRIPGREMLFKWVRPLGKGGTTFLYRLKKNSHITPHTLDEARQFQVVTNRDTMNHLWLQSHGFGRLQTSSTIEHIVRMFFKGRGDLLAFNDTTLKAEFEHFGFEPSEVVPVMPLFETLPYMAVSLATPDAMVQRLQQAYDALVVEGQITFAN